MEEFNLKIVEDLIKLAKNQEVKKLKVSFKEFSVFVDFTESNFLAPSFKEKAGLKEQWGSSLAKEQQTNSNKKTVTAPIIGTFYNRPAPDKQPFVTVGDKVKKGDVLCIIESMKLMNEIKSEFDGVVLKILVESGEVVEYNQPIFILK